MDASHRLDPRSWLRQWSRGQLATPHWLAALATLTLAAGLYCTLSSLSAGSLPRPALSLAWGVWISASLGLGGWAYLRLQQRLAERVRARRGALLLVLMAMPVLMAAGDRALAALYWGEAYLLTADHVLSRLPFSLLLLAAIELPLWMGTRGSPRDAEAATRPRASSPPPAPAPAIAVEAPGAATPAPPRFRIATRSGLRVLDAAAITAVRSAGNCVEFVAGGEVLLHRETLANVERALAAHGLMRVHRSHLVRVGDVERIVKHRGNGWTLRLRDGSDIPVGRAFQPAVEQALVTRH